MTGKQRLHQAISCMLNLCLKTQTNIQTLIIGAGHDGWA